MDFINSYTILKVKFKFPEICFYPNIPVRLDKSTIVYPLEGESICTRSEFLLAMNLNCEIEIEYGIYIPFYTTNEKTDFNLKVRGLVEERRKHPAKSYYNLLYKLIANSGIGQMSRGGCLVKKLTRVNMTSFTYERVNVTREKNIYLISHLTNADLCMLRDFDNFKEGLSIVNKCLVTLGKPLLIWSSNLIVRDTMLLSPAGNRSLESIGRLYSLEKVSLSKEQKEDMNILIKKDKRLFEAYALRDALITLIHANHMEDFNFSLKQIGVSITLSGLGSNYVKNY